MCLLFIFLTSASGADSFEILYQTQSLQKGPYIDAVIYYDAGYSFLNRLDSITSGFTTIDGLVPKGYLSSIPSDISLHEIHGYDIRFININCERYPLNISGFRRAFAFAFNKTKMRIDHVGGVYNYFLEQDSVVPMASEFCVENDFPYFYYDADLALANSMLDLLNFTVDPGTGYRLAPDGTPINVTVNYFGSSTSFYIAEYAVETLSALNIAAYQTYRDMYYDDTWYFEGDYYMMSTESHYSSPTDWLVEDFWSGYANSNITNLCRYRNDTFDYWRDQLLYGLTYTDVYDASREMQLNLHYNVPRLIVCGDLYYQMYRDDTFVGFTPETSTISGEWTLRKIHPIESETGGTLRISVENILAHFNIFYNNYRQSTSPISLLYSSLFDYGPNNEVIPDLATSMILETHTDNPSVPVGHSRYTIDIIHNATWSDGTPLTGADVAFTYNYELVSGSYGNPAGASFENLVIAYSPIPSRVVVEFDIESYWLLDKFAFNYIIPEHIFNDDYGLGYEAWNEWDPVINTTYPHVTSGPFLVDDYVPSNSVTFRYSPLFYYLPEQPDGTSSTTSPTGLTNVTSLTNVTTTFSDGALNLSLESILLISTCTISAIVIIYCTVRIHQKKSRDSN